MGRLLSEGRDSDISKSGTITILYVFHAKEYLAHSKDGRCPSCADAPADSTNRLRPKFSHVIPAIRHIRIAARGNPKHTRGFVSQSSRMVICKT